MRGEPDLSLEAVLVLPTAEGGTETAFLPIGKGWRTRRGDYVFELVRDPIEWAWSEERRLYVRLRKDQFR